MKKITPFLWFDTQAEEAMNFYLSVFKNSKVLSVSPASVNFELEGQEFIGFNAGPDFKFNEAISMFVDCPTQEEVVVIGRLHDAVGLGHLRDQRDGVEPPRMVRHHERAVTHNRQPAIRVRAVQRQCIRAHLDQAKRAAGFADSATDDDVAIAGAQVDARDRGLAIVET